MSRTLGIVLSVLMLLAASVASTQPAQEKRAKWSAVLEPKDARAGESAQIIVTATIDKGWHIYSLDSPEGPISTSITIPEGALVEKNGEIAAPEPIRVEDAQFKAVVGWYGDQVKFGIPVKIKEGASGTQKVELLVTSQACDLTRCMRPEFDEPVALSFDVQPGEPRTDRMAALTAVPEQPAQVDHTGKGIKGSDAPKTDNAPTAGGGNAQTDEFVSQVNQSRSEGLLSFLWLAFSMGLLALLTPCVYPMIPITVSFFSKKRSENDKPNYLGAASYSFGIVATFTGLGLAVTALLGAAGVNSIATNLYVNIALAVIFLVLAYGLFTGREFTIPSSVVTKLSGKSRTAGSIVGPLLMGFVFTLTSFTCTVPFVGTLLGAASTGDYVYPALGMLAFSAAFAMPFFLLALFPGWLSKMPKSGSWMTAVKVTMGFLEIAAALKFISNVELNLNLGLLTRPVFLALWAMTALLAGLYLLGWIKLGKEEEKPRVGWVRRGFAVVCLAGAWFCLAAMQGRSLGTFVAYLPPDPYPGQEGTVKKGEIEWIESYEEAQKIAKEQNKPMFIDFTGVYCTNCRLIEEQVFPKSDVVKELKNYVTVKLYTDRNSAADKANFALQQKFTGVVTLPVYAMVTPDGKVLKVHQQVPPLEDEAQFIKALQAGREALTTVAQK